MQRNWTSGFTLIELLVVITIIAVLASIAYPVFSGVQERARATEDLNNLRQIGIATQMYLNDNDNVLFAPNEIWMEKLNPKYISSWKVFRSAFDKRSPSELKADAPVSYGFNRDARDTTAANTPIGADKITNTAVFVLFAPAQDSSTTVAFDGTGDDPAPGVSVLKAASSPGGTAQGGTHGGRKRINALCADLHVENMPWTTFNNSVPKKGDENAAQRWDPLAPAP